jgi:hypothetical protein
MIDLISNALEWWCRLNEQAIAYVGLDRPTFAFFSAIITWGLAAGFLAVWLEVFPRLRRHGLGRLQQRLVWWFVTLFALFQGFQTLAWGWWGHELIPCPIATVLPIILAFFFFSVAFGAHVQSGNRASLAKFTSFVFVPVVGEIGLTSKWAAGGVIRLIQFIFHHFG